MTKASLAIFIVLIVLSLLLAIVMSGQPYGWAPSAQNAGFYWDNLPGNRCMIFEVQPDPGLYVGQYDQCDF